MLDIKEKTVIDDWEALMRSFLEMSHKISEKEKQDGLIKQFAEHLKEKNRIVFCAYKNNAPCGFIAGKNAGKVFEITSFFIEESSYEDNCGAELVKAITSKVFDSGYKYYRQNLDLTFNRESSFTETLEKDGFIVYPRSSMTLILDEADEESITLAEGYSFLPFLLERLDESLEAVIGSMTDDHTDVLIYPSMRDKIEFRTMFGKFTDDFKALKPELNPQVVFGNRIVGACFLITPSDTVAFVVEIGVHRDHQRKGLGKAMMKKIIQGCKSNGFKKIGLGVTDSNIGAIKLYEKLGFKVVNTNLTIVKHA